MKEIKIREVRNYEGAHVGMLGTDSDPRFPLVFAAVDRHGRAVVRGCAASRRHAGCLLAWAIMFHDKVFSLSWPRH